jgi:hypothetical protein
MHTTHICVIINQFKSQKLVLHTYTSHLLIGTNVRFFVLIPFCVLFLEYIKVYSPI